MIENSSFEKQRKCFEKSIEKEISKYLIKKAIKNGLINAKTGENIIKNFS